ncbi:MAG: PilZ domain-containing protein [Oligoflexales bacterium]
MDLEKKISRSKRVDERLALQIKTFGSPEVYQFHTLNISHSGVLVACYDVVPFNKNTILEITLDPEVNTLKKSMYALGRIVRIVKGYSQGFQKYKSNLGEDMDIKSVMGITIFDLNDQDQKIWREFVLDASLHAA